VPEPMSWLCTVFFREAFKLGSTRASVAFLVASGRVVTTLSHRAGITSSLSIVKHEGRGRTPGFHSVTSSRLDVK
jgi:hypothetical protein